MQMYKKSLGNKHNLSQKSNRAQNPSLVKKKKTKRNLYIKENFQKRRPTPLLMFSKIENLIKKNILYPNSAPSKDAGCSSDTDCPQTETCRNHVCVNPCQNGNPCARNAECQAQNHRAVCQCPAPLIGDPFTNCFAEDIVVKPECTSDSECSETTSCINQRCRNPCADRNPCAGNAECRVSQHRPLCYCPLGWGGDPQVQCYKRKYYTILFIMIKYILIIFLMKNQPFFI